MKILKKLYKLKEEFIPQINIQKQLKSIESRSTQIGSELVKLVLKHNEQKKKLVDMGIKEDVTSLSDAARKIQKEIMEIYEGAEPSKLKSKNRTRKSWCMCSIVFQKELQFVKKTRTSF